ncbi:MAG: TrkH family potassium uptake protein [Rhodospirillales bacterium]|nr:TrkH family potassium uptake protein [Alphaproteobacteria bacterium]MCB9981363.1 TrkH family potassium uptake protein [Rhodospirillales bacterium]
MDFRPVLYIQGILLSILSIGMLIPMLADMYWSNPDWKVFFLCIVITAFFGGSLILSNAGLEFTMNLRQAFMMTFMSWVVTSLFACIPLALSGQNLSFTDAFFEAVSGITTTGSTVMTNLDKAPPGILLWRSILQWLGGIGIVLMAMSVLPMLSVGGMQIFRTELSESEKALPRTAQLASSIGAIYIGLTMLCLLAYLLAGMGKFDALNHALTTLATGGFSTYDASLGHFHSDAIELLCTFFMIVAGTPFILYLKAIRGNLRPLLVNSQVRMFLLILSLSIATTTTYLVTTQDMNAYRAFIGATFNMTSLMTGTGFASEAYDQWGGFVIALTFFLMGIGACAGSTSCGIKIFRFEIFLSVIRVQIQKLLHPHGAFVAHYNGKPIPEDVPLSVMSFLFLYAICFIALALALSALGLDFITSLSGAMTSISNVGPGLGEVIGPSGNFSTLPDSAKWVLSVGMLLGRLEILAALILLHPSFWRH